MADINLLTDNQKNEILNLLEKIDFKNHKNLELLLKLLKDTIDTNSQSVYSPLLTELERLDGLLKNHYNDNTERLNFTYTNLLLLISICEICAHKKRTDSIVESLKPLWGIQNDYDSHIKTLDNYRGRYITMANETNDLGNRLRKQSELVGVTKHAKHFLDAADTHKKRSYFWAIFSAVISILIILFSGWQLYCPPRIDSEFFTPRLVIETILPRITLLGTVFILLFAGIKNLNASNHNYVVNKHRQNALSSFLDFAESTKDHNVKSALLLQATQCIYNHQPTGYVNSKSDNDPSEIPKCECQ